MEKYEWKKEEPWYKALKKPQIFHLPPQNFIMLHGFGDPNQEDFSQRVQALYGLSYTLRMSYKNDWDIPGFFPYTVYPLTGFWTIQEKYWGQPLEKAHFEYDIMIQQPSFVTEAIFEEAKKRAVEKVDPHLLTASRLETIPAKVVGQILHVGPYDTESASFAILESFLSENKQQRKGKEHTEIYLSDPRKSAPEKQKTLLRLDLV